MSRAPARHPRIALASRGRLAFACCLLAATWLLDGGAAFAKPGKSPVKRGSSPGKSYPLHGKPLPEPPDLWVRLRSRFSLAIPQPVRWPVGSGQAAESTFGDFSRISLIRGQSARAAGTTRLLPTAAAPEPSSPGPVGLSPIPLSDLAPIGAPAARESDADSLAEWIRLKRQQAAYERLNGQFGWLSRHLAFVQASADRAAFFLHLITEELTRQRVPLDFALLPIVESGFSPQAVSVKGASGLWQFMPVTGDEYGLWRDDWFDSRLDVPASTRAAARYLAFLGRKFNGDWLLAAAAYNAGIGRVQQAIEINRTHELPTDFWSLSLPQETMDYVPRLLALTAVFSRPGNHSLTLKPIPDRPRLTRIRFERPLELTELAGLAGMNAGEFALLNAAFIRGALPAERPSELLLPIERTFTFGWRMRLNDLIVEDAESALPKRPVYHYSELAAGDSLALKSTGAPSPRINR